MQSTARKLKRGNAHIVFDMVTKQEQIITKRGTPKKVWDRACKESMPASEQAFIDQTEMLAKESIERLKQN